MAHGRSMILSRSRGREALGPLLFDIVETCPLRRADSLASCQLATACETKLFREKNDCFFSPCTADAVGPAA